jgi:uncharacterized protein (DUF169 family)
MMDVKALDRELTIYIRPLSFPPGIKFLKSEEEIPELTRRPLKDMKRRVAIRQAYGMERKVGWSFAISYYLDGNLCAGMFTADQEAGRRSEDFIGLRYPIKSFFNFEQQFPPSYRKLGEIWKEREG